MDMFSKLKEKTSRNKNINSDIDSPDRKRSSLNLNSTNNSNDDIDNAKRNSFRDSILGRSSPSKPQYATTQGIPQHQLPPNQSLQQQQQGYHSTSSPSSFPTQVPNVNFKSNFELIRDFNRKLLGDVLAKTGYGSFALVMDSTITPILNLIVDAHYLNSNGALRIYKLKKGRIDTECRSIVYFVKPNLNNINTIIDQIRIHRMENFKKDYTIIYFPKMSIAHQHLLEQEGCYLTPLEYPINLIPLDYDLLTLEQPLSYASILLDKDRSPLFHIVKSIHQIQQYFGQIPIIRGKGTNAKLIMESLLKTKSSVSQPRERYHGNQNQNNNTVDNGNGGFSTEFDQLILLDREVDFITPLITPLTYEGLVNDFFSINCNVVMLEEKLVSPPDLNNFRKLNKQQQQQQMLKQQQQQASRTELPFPLNSSDRVYKELRDLNFSSLVGQNGVLSTAVKNLDDIKIKGSDSLTAIRDAIKRVQGSKHEENSLRVHVGIAEKIQTISCDKYFRDILENEQRLLNDQDIGTVEEYIVDCIFKKEPLAKVLKMMSLYCLIMGGMRYQMYENAKMHIIQLYGCQHLITLNNLERIGLLRTAQEMKTSSGQTKSTFFYLCKELKLMVDDIDELNPNDFAYVHSGYAPLSIRIIQYLFKQKEGWKNIEEQLNLLPGPIFEEYIQQPQQQQSLSSSFIPSLLGVNNNNNNSNNNQGNDLASPRPKTLVYFIGGVTYSEIASLRFLSNKLNRDFIVLTTKIINGDSFLNLFIEQ